MNKNIKEKFKQITLTVFAITLIGVGYMNFNLENIDMDNVEKLQNELSYSANEILKSIVDVYKNSTPEERNKIIKGLVGLAGFGLLVKFLKDL